MADKINRRPTILQLAIVEAWADGLSSSEIAKKCNCSIDNVYKVKQLKHLKYMFYEKQQEKVQELTPLAIQKLAGLLKAENTPPNVLLATAKEILERSHINELLEIENAKPIEHDISIKVEYV